MTIRSIPSPVSMQGRILTAMTQAPKEIAPAFTGFTAARDIVSRVAGYFGNDHSAIFKMISSMVHSGLLEKHTNSYSYVMLSPAGRVVANSYDTASSHFDVHLSNKYRELSFAVTQIRDEFVGFIQKGYRRENFPLFLTYLTSMTKTLVDMQTFERIHKADVSDERFAKLQLAKRVSYHRVVSLGKALGDHAALYVGENHEEQTQVVQYTLQLVRYLSHFGSVPQFAEPLRSHLIMGKLSAD